MTTSVVTHPVSPEAQLFDGLNNVKSPGEIAASVSRTSQHAADETSLAQAKARREEVLAEIRRLNGERGKIGLPVDAKITALTAEYGASGAALQALRLKAIAGRQVHAAAVLEALESTITAAAGRGLQAVAALQEALEVLDDCNAALRAASGEPIFLPYVDFESLGARLGRLAGKS